MNGSGLTINTAPATPSWEEHTTTVIPGSRDESTKALSPEQQALVPAQTALTGEQKAIADKTKTVADSTSEINSQAAQQMAAAATEADKAKEAAITDSDATISHWRDRMREANEKYMNAPVVSLFHDGDTGRNVLKGIGLALAAVGDAKRTTSMLLAHQDPGSSSAVDDIINRDFTVQREAIANLKDKAVMAASGLKDAEEGRKLLFANIDVKQAAVYERIKQMTAARLATLGKAQNEIDQNQLYANADKEALANRSKAVEGLTTEVTKKFGGTHERIDREPTAAKPGATPTSFTDSLTGKDLPVDPQRTDMRQHNAAVDKLTATNTMIETGLKLLNDYDKNGLNSPEVVDNALGGGNAAPQGERNADLTRLRSAYPASRGESVSAENMKHITDALPDAPSSISLPGAGATWRAKVKALVDENISRRDALLSAAGVPTPDIPKLSPGEISNRAATRGSNLEAPGAAPQAATPQLLVKPTNNSPAPTNDKRAAAIRMLKANPNLPGAPTVMKRLGITPQDLVP